MWHRAYGSVLVPWTRLGNSTGESVIGFGSTLIPVWVDMLQAGSAFCPSSWYSHVLVLMSSNRHSPPSWFSYLQHEKSESYVVAVVILSLELLCQEFLDALMFWRRFSPILDTLMFWCRRSPGTQRTSIAHGQAFNAESVASGDSVLDIRQETKSNDEGWAL
jgi:hypothetical protein